MQDDTPEFFDKEVAKEGKKIPKGMPPLSLVRQEAALMGLPESDADFMYDTWLANGFRTKTGGIKDWRAAFRTYQRASWLPSQKKQGYQRPNAQEEVLKRIRRARDGR